MTTTTPAGVVVGRLGRAMPHRVTVWGGAAEHALSVWLWEGGAEKALAPCKWRLDSPRTLRQYGAKTDTAASVRWGALSASDPRPVACRVVADPVEEGASTPVVMVDQGSAQITGATPGCTYRVEATAVGNGVLTTDSDPSVVTITMTGEKPTTPRTRMLPPRNLRPAPGNVANSGTLAIRWIGQIGEVFRASCRSLKDGRMMPTVVVDRVATATLDHRASEDYEFKVTTIGAGGLVDSHPATLVLNSSGAASTLAPRAADGLSVTRDPLRATPHVYTKWTKQSGGVTPTSYEIRVAKKSSPQTAWTVVELDAVDIATDDGHYAYLVKELAFADTDTALVTVTAVAAGGKAAAVTGPEMPFTDSDEKNRARNFTAVSRAAGQVTLEWDMPTDHWDVDQWSVKYGATVSGTQQTKTFTTAQSHQTETITGLAPGHYYFRLGSVLRDRHTGRDHVMERVLTDVRVRAI